VQDRAVVAKDHKLHRPGVFGYPARVSAHVTDGIISPARMPQTEELELLPGATTVPTAQSREGDSRRILTGSDLSKAFIGKSPVRSCNFALYSLMKHCDSFLPLGEFTPPFDKTL